MYAHKHLPQFRCYKHILAFADTPSEALLKSRTYLSLITIYMSTVYVTIACSQSLLNCTTYLTWLR